MKKLAIAALLLSVSVPAFAHEEFRTVGVIQKRIMEQGKLKYIEVRPDGAHAITFWVMGTTEITQDDKKVDGAALAVGKTVVLDSWGDIPDYSEIVKVRIVPAIPGAK